MPVTQAGFGGYREEDPAFDAYRDWPKSSAGNPSLGRS